MATVTNDDGQRKRGGEVTAPLVERPLERDPNPTQRAGAPLVYTPQGHAGPGSEEKAGGAESSWAHHPPKEMDNVDKMVQNRAADPARASGRETLGAGAGRSPL